MSTQFRMRLRIKVACSDPRHVVSNEEEVILPARRFLGPRGGFCEHCIPKVELLNELPQGYRAGIKMHLPGDGAPENVFVIDTDEEDKWVSSVL